MGAQPFVISYKYSYAIRARIISSDRLFMIPLACLPLAHVVVADNIDEHFLSVVIIVTVDDSQQTSHSHCDCHVNKLEN